MPITPRDPETASIWVYARLKNSAELAALVGDRIYPDFGVPAEVVTPYVYWSQSGDGVAQHAGPHQIQMVMSRFNVRGVLSFPTSQQASFNGLRAINKALQTAILDTSAPSLAGSAGNVWEARFIDFYRQEYEQGDRRFLELGFTFRTYST